jgi:hypothetical protein
MYTETNLYLGTELQAIDMYRWCNQYAIEQRGFMAITLVRLVDNLDDMYPHSRRDYAPIHQALREADLTHGVVVTHYQCDDETDGMLETAWNKGLHNLVLYDPSDLEEGARPFSPAETLRLDDGSAYVRRIPFRLELWTPVESTGGSETESVYLP